MESGSCVYVALQHLGDVFVPLGHHTLQAHSLVLEYLAGFKVFASSPRCYRIYTNTWEWNVTLLSVDVSDDR